MTTHRNAHRHPTVVLLASIAPRTARSLLLTVIRLVTLSLFFWAPSFGCTTETRTAHVWPRSLRVCTRRRRDTLQRYESMRRVHQKA
ncbi:hypothetical protein EDB83DRAFT_2477350 [Lactarius deliciosus]|nr:hypothetical protein EDB83DRAFT_2477350 [Lactarius deliciosus]